jgi:hypothetical protein
LLLHRCRRCAVAPSVYLIHYSFPLNKYSSFSSFSSSSSCQSTQPSHHRFSWIPHQLLSEPSRHLFTTLLVFVCVCVCMRERACVCVCLGEEQVQGLRGRAPVTAAGAGARTAMLPASASITARGTCEWTAGICWHNSIRSRCNDCGGASICQRCRCSRTLSITRLWLAYPLRYRGC